MRLEEFKPSSCQEAQEFSLSGAVTIELIQAAFAKDALFRFKVKGFSMSPFIKDEDIITLSPVWRSKGALGKLVACVCPEHKKLVVHRVVGRKSNRYLIRGDSCLEPDCLMGKEDILGCVTKIERENKAFFFSLGPERIAIAFLSRNGLLPAFFFSWRLIPRFFRRLIKCRILL